MLLSPFWNFGTLKCWKFGTWKRITWKRNKFKTLKLFSKLNIVDNLVFLKAYSFDFSDLNWTFVILSPLSWHETVTCVNNDLECVCDDLMNCLYIIYCYKCNILYYFNIFLCFYVFIYTFEYLNSYAFTHFQCEKV